MSAQEYNTIRRTPVLELGRIPASQLVAFLNNCRPLVRDAILMARLNR